MELQLPVLAPPGSLLLPLALPGPADHVVPPDVHLRPVTRCQSARPRLCASNDHLTLPEMSERVHDEVCASESQEATLRASERVQEGGAPPVQDR